MSVLRWVWVGIVALVAVVVQTAVLARLPVPGPVPDLAVLVVIAVALVAGANPGAIAGCGVGLLVAIVPPDVAPMGAAALVYTVLGYLVGARAAGQQLSRAEVAALSGAAGALASAFLLVVGAVWGQGWPGLLVAGLLIALQGVYCAVLGAVVAPTVSRSIAALPSRM